MRVEVTEAVHKHGQDGVNELESKVRTELRSRLAVSANIRLVGPNTIPRSEGKAKRLVDLREM